MAAPPIPVILFAYARPVHLGRTLACLRENRVPLLHVFSDGPKGGHDAAAVAEVRAMLRTIDRCECRVVERPANLGLGRNVLAGVSEVAEQHDAFWSGRMISSACPAPMPGCVRRSSGMPATSACGA